MRKKRRVDKHHASVVCVIIGCYYLQRVWPSRRWIARLTPLCKGLRHLWLAGLGLERRQHALEPLLSVEPWACLQLLVWPRHPVRRPTWKANWASQAILHALAAQPCRATMTPLEHRAAAERNQVLLIEGTCKRPRLSDLASGSGPSPTPPPAPTPPCAFL